MASVLLTPHSWLLTALGSSWVPFVTPAPLWGVWWVLLFPLLAGVAIVYKNTKCRRVGRAFVEAAQLWAYTAAFMALGALALTVLVKLVLG